MSIDETITVLLVDDDEIEAIWIKRQLAKLEGNFTVLHASDGEEGLELLLGHKIACPNIVFLDINMPRMDGHEFLTRLRQDPIYRSTVVFMMTSSEAMLDKQKAYDQNVAGYLLKACDPASGKKIAAMIQSYCDSVQLPQLKVS